MINKANELPVSRHAKLFKISRGAVYYLAKPFSPADLALMRHIDKLQLEPPSWAQECCPTSLACRAYIWGADMSGL